MTIQQLRYILTVAKTGSITEAARQLFISQPSLSNAIKEIEKETGIAIFLRSRTGITLTKDGMEFLGHARQVIQQMELLEDRYVTALPQKVKFGVSTHHYSFTDDVKNRTCDLGIIYLSKENETVIRRVLEDYQLVFTELFVAKPHVFLRKNHPLAKQTSLSLKDLEAYPRLNFAQNEYESVYYAEELFSHIPTDKAIRTNDRGAIVNFLLGLDAYTIASGIFPKYLNGDNIIAIPLEEDEYMCIGYILNANQELSELGKLYIEEIKNMPLR